MCRFVFCSDQHTLHFILSIQLGKGGGVEKPGERERQVYVCVCVKYTHLCVFARGRMCA